MPYNQSLRNRIMISFFLFSVMLTLFIALVVYVAIESMESSVIEESLTSELVNFQQNPKQSLDSVTRPSAYITRYYASLDDQSWLPDYLQSLSIGLGEFELGDKHYYVQVSDVLNGRVYIIKDVTDFEAREIALHWALIIICIIGPLLGLWVGKALSGRVILPVANLARQLSNMPADSRNSPRIASGYAKDEVGQLALTFDQYLQRIEQFISREQEFTDNASHELRTPLAIIHGAAELLIDNPELPEKARNQVARIARANQRMSQMVEVLLLLARNRSQDEVGVSCELQDVVNEVLEQNEHLLKDKPITLHCEVASVQLEAPKAPLSIVLSNLLRNAAIYTEQGDIWIRGDAKSISVIDSGPGISEEEQQRVFQRHYRSERARLHQGCGIGLSIVQRICERYQWVVEVDSTPGTGTSIMISFPQK